MKQVVVLLICAASALGQSTPRGIQSPADALKGSTVANLPAAGKANRIRFVTDGTTATDCTVGGGSNVAICRDSGSAWASVGGVSAPVLVGNGTNAAPAYSFSAQTGTGLWRAANLLGLAVNGTDSAAVSTTGIQIASGFVYSFSSAGGATAASVDTGISRDAAGVIDIGNGIAGDKSGTLKLSQVVTSGASAGSIAFTQGSAQVTGTTNITEQAPTAVTSYLVTKPGTAAQGINVGTLSGSTITQGFSGDANHAATVTVGSGTSIGSTSLCSTTFCPAGTYRVNSYLDITTPCGTSGTYSVSLVWTDDQGSKTVVIPMQGAGESAGVLTTTSTSNFGQASTILRSTGAASINYLTTAAACGSAGPMVGKLYLSVEPIQ